jgi:hypothetical protein
MGKSKKRAIQRAVRRAEHRWEKQTSDSEWLGGLGIVTRKKRAIKRAAPRARGSPVRETSDIARDAAGKASVGERNQRYSKRRGGRDVGGRKKPAMQRAAQRERREQE